jgi:transposase
VATIPAKANIGKQAEFLISSLYPCLQEAMKGFRTVLFVDAAHFVHGSFLGCLWSKMRVFVKTPSGRRRLNVLGAVNGVTKQLHIFSNETYITSQVLCEFLKEMATIYVGQPITLVLDNARYQRCKLVEECAGSLGIQLLFLPPYSPNLNIIERVWKFIKKKALNSRYYETFADFRTAILKAVESCNDEWNNDLKSLLTLNFQTFSTSTDSLPLFDDQFSEENLRYGQREMKKITAAQYI